MASLKSVLKNSKTKIIILEKKHIDSLNIIEIDSLKLRIPFHEVKILEGNYFGGISKNNIKNIYDKLIKMNVAYFSYDVFLCSECTDIDFKKDIKNHYFIESIPILVKHAKPSRLSGRGVRSFRKKNNKGIQWSDRKGATLQNPYLKIYHKSIELNFNSKEFKDEFLAEIDLSNIIRVEFTIKSMKHLRKFKIESQKLIDLLNLSQNIKSAMLKDIINTHLMSRIVKAEKPIGKISPTGVVFYNALNIISKRTYMNKNMIIDSMLENIKNKTAKSRKKKKLNEIWNTYIQMQEHNKKKEKIISLFDAICW